MGLFDFLGKSKRQREIDKIIEKSKEYLQQGEHYYAYVELKNIIYGKTEDDKTYRKDEVAQLYAESQKAARGDIRRRDLKSEVNETAAGCCEKAMAGSMTEGEALYKAAKELDLGDKKPWDETQAAHWHKQMAEAYKYYEKAAEKGYEKAILRYAEMSEKGLGTECNKEKAFLLYQKLAEQGSIEGKYELAGCYYFGKGVTSDIKKALELYEEVAQQGHANAQEMCGYMYLYGYGNYVDYEKAYRWYKKSEQNGKTVTNSWYKKEKKLRKGREDEELKKDKKDQRIEKAKQLVAEEKCPEVLNLLENDYDYEDDDPLAGYRFEEVEELYLLCEDKIAQAAKEAEWQASRELYIATYGEDPWAQTDTDDDKEEEETDLDREWRLHRESLLEKYDKVYGFDKRNSNFPMFRWGKSAEQWFAEGKKYFDYGENKTEIARALECYEKAAMMGHRKAMSRCEHILYELEGYESENAEYWMYKKEQFEDGDSICSDAMHAAHRAEYEYERRLWREARNLLKKAIDLNNSDAMLEYARMYLAGEGVPEDKRVGYYWLERAAKVSPLTEVYKIFVFLHMNDMDSPFFDREKVLYWTRKAAFGDDKDMMMSAAALYEQDEDNQSALLEALAWAEKAVEKDDEKGAEKDDATIMYLTGMLCLKTKKYRRAVNWFEKSVKLGNEDAEEILEELRECSDEIPQEEEAPPPPPRPTTAEEEAKFETERMATAGEKWKKVVPSEPLEKPVSDVEIESMKRRHRSGHIWLPPEDSETTIPEHGEYPVTAEYRAEMKAQADKNLKEMVEQYGVDRIVYKLWESDYICCSCFKEDGTPLILSVYECYCKDIIAEMEYRWGCLIYYVVDMGNALYMFAVHNDKNCWQYGKMGGDTVTVLYLNLEDKDDNAYIEVNVTVTDGIISCSEVQFEEEEKEDKASAEKSTAASDMEDSSSDSKSASEPVTGKATPQQMYREAHSRLMDLSANFGLDAAALASFEKGRLCRSYTDENGQSYIIEEDESADSVMIARELEANGRYLVYHIIENNDVLYLLAVYIYADDWHRDRRNGDIIGASIFGENGSDFEFDDIRISCTKGVLKAERIGVAAEKTDEAEQTEKVYEKTAKTAVIPEKPATPESMRAEGVFRLEYFVENLGLFKIIPINFFNGGVYCSTRSPSGFYNCEKLDSIDEYAKAVNLYEKNTGCMVYYVIANGSQPYFLSVDRNENRWAQERPDGNKMEVCIYDIEKDEYHCERVILYNEGSFIYAKEIMADDQRRDNEKPASPESMREEARRRLDTLVKNVGLSLGIPRLFSEGEVYCSTTKLNGDPDCQPVKYFPSYYPAVQAHEEDTGCLVYHVIANGLNPYFLTVHRDENRWEQEKEAGDIWPVCIYDTNDEDYHYEYRRLYTRDGKLFAEEATEEELNAVRAERRAAAEAAEEAAAETEEPCENAAEEAVFAAETEENCAETAEEKAVCETKIAAEKKEYNTATAEKPVEEATLEATESAKAAAEKKELQLIDGRDWEWWFDEGIKYYKGDGVGVNYTKALECMEKSALLGSEVAMNNCGSMHSRGMGTPVDYEKALYWHKMSAEKGYAYAQYDLATLYLKGTGCEKDVEKGFIWLEKAADNGHKKACLVMAEYSEEKEDADRAKILRWYETAAQQGDSDAMMHCFDMYGIGDGCEKDEEKANYWGNKALEANNAEMLFRIGNAELNKGANNVDIKKVLHDYLVPSAEQGHKEALYLCGYSFLVGAGFEQDKEHGIKLMESAAKEGSKNAMEMLNKLYAEGKLIAADSEKAFYWLVQMAESGDTDAMKQVAEAYENTENSFADIKKAIYWYEKLALAGDVEAMYRAAILLHKHSDTEENAKKVVYWINRAADEGHPEAMKMMTQVYLNKKDYGNVLKYGLKSAENGDIYAMRVCTEIYRESLGGIEKDVQKAFYWAEKAAQQGRIEDMMMCAMMYINEELLTPIDKEKAHYWIGRIEQAVEEGAEYEQFTEQIAGLWYFGARNDEDLSKAFCWYKKSAESGNKNSMYQCLIMRLRGAGCKKNYDKAMEFAVLAAQQGDGGHMLYQVANNFHYGENGLEVNKTEALRWYERAGEYGNVKAMVRCGAMLYSENATYAENARALYWNEKAAEAGDVNSMSFVAVMYDQGIGTAENHEKAFYWFKKAADAGHELSMYNLAGYYSLGKGGVPIDLHKAKEWYEAASKCEDKKISDMAHFAALVMEESIKRKK